MLPTPLTGKTVIDLSALVPGPYASSLLQYFGATVVKVETPTGDPLRKMNPQLFTQLNRGKKSVAVDLKNDQARARLLTLLDRADGVIDGFRPGVMDRLGLGFSALSARNPKIVMLSLSGFGQDGPYRDHAAHDINILGMAGYFAVPSQIDGAITRPNIRLADFIPGQTGAMSMAMAMISAGASGTGSHIDCAMFDCTASWSLPFLLATRDRDPHDPASYPHVMADSALFETRDGQFLTLGTLEDKFWNNIAPVLAEVDPALADPVFATRRGRDGHKQQLHDLLTACFRTRDFADWADALSQVDTAWGPVYKGTEALNDPHLRARGLVDEDQDACAFPALFSGTRPQNSGDVPALGQDNDTLLC